MKCNICKSTASFLFKTIIMSKYDVEYYRCVNCDFIQTEKPFWLKEAYGETITNLDIGYVTRNLSFAETTRMLIRQRFNKKASFIDYGGGYGMFTRLMRDQGFSFYLEDPYCENIFAKQFHTGLLPKETKFELLTAFEVFEHLDNPIEEIDKMFAHSSSILFSTELQPNNLTKKAEDWWYFTPETGQHISLYTYKTLDFIAKKYNVNLYSNNYNLHLFTDKKFSVNPLKFISLYKYYKDKLFNMHFQNKNSLLQSDYALIKKINK